MACFVTKTTIPSGFATGKPDVHTVLVDDTIWILFNNERDFQHPTKQFYNFQTASFTLEKVESVFPDERTYGRLIEVKSSQNNIYGFFFKTNEVLRLQTSIFKFDVNTLEWQFLISFSGYENSFGPIVGNHLYVVKPPENCEKPLMKVNLTTNEVEDIPFHYVPGFNGLNLMENNGKVYAVENFSDERLIVVSQVGNGAERELNRFYYNNVEEISLSITNLIHVENGHVLKSWQHSRERNVVEANTIYLELFDFTTNKWERTALPGFIRKDTDCISNMITKGNNCFAVFQEKLERNQYSIQMIERASMLSTICLVDLIDRTNSADTFQQIREDLTVPSRRKLDNMLGWKVPVNDARLAQQQKVGIVEQIVNMETDGTVDHNMQRKLRTVFDSDFSDSSDSDVTDREDEAFEESEDENNAQYRYSNREIVDERIAGWSQADHRVPPGFAPDFEHQIIFDEHFNFDNNDEFFRF